MYSLSGFDLVWYLILQNLTEFIGMLHALVVSHCVLLKLGHCPWTILYGVLRRFGVFLRFRFLSVHACVTLLVLSFVGWTCPRVLVRSTWNLFRSTIYELKLCTSYFWSTSVCPSVRQNGRNIASHTGLLVIFFSILWIELVLGF